MRRSWPVPPENGAYMNAAYIVAAVIITVYTASLLIRIRRERKR
jgi:hypothetical protein